MQPSAVNLFITHVSQQILKMDAGFLHVPKNIDDWLIILIAKQGKSSNYYFNSYHTESFSETLPTVFRDGNNCDIDRYCLGITNYQNYQLSKLTPII